MEQCPIQALWGKHHPYQTPTHTQRQTGMRNDRQTHTHTRTHTQTHTLTQRVTGVPPPGGGSDCVAGRGGVQGPGGCAEQHPAAVLQSGCPEIGRAHV